jgi:hypothetical protein
LIGSQVPDIIVNVWFDLRDRMHFLSLQG